MDFWISIDDYVRLALLKVLITLWFRVRPSLHEMCVLLLLEERAPELPRH